MRRLGMFSRDTHSQYGQPRRRVGSNWRWPIRISFIFLLILIPLGLRFGLIWEVQSVEELSQKSKQILIANSEKVGFSIKGIYVHGRVETNKQTLLSALQLKYGTPTFSFSPNEVMVRLMALPWISKAIVKRQLPDIVYISLIERVPLALWQHNGRFNLIDASGKIIPNQNIGRFSNLKVVVGRDAPKHASKLFDTISVVPELAKRVKAAIRVGDRRWDIQMDNELEIYLPETEAVSAWVQLAELQELHNFMEGDVAVVDLRIPDRIVLRKPDLRENITTQNLAEKNKNTRLRSPWDT